MNKRFGHAALATLLILAFSLVTSTSNRIAAQALTIHNDVFWDTKDGQPIYSQGGGIFKFTDPATGIKKYYWYGVRYREADTYRQNPAVTLGTSTFETVTCYSSTDLVNWAFEGNVLTTEELRKHGGDKQWVGRLGVAYLPELRKYVMVVQHGKEVLFTTADTPTGQFAWHQQISMQDMIGTTNTGDQTVFTDEDSGKSYLIYSYGNGRNKLYVSEIGVKDGKANLLDCKQVFAGESREGNCMFKYRGKYYMCASNIYGWDSSLAYYLVADDIRGPYTPEKSMAVLNGCADDYAHVTQTGFFCAVKGSKQETIVYCGDRWANFAGNGLGYNHWVPLSFTGATPYFNSLSAWQLDAKTGEWGVAPANNYAKNGSFEADRRPVPTPVKPLQLQLTGWTTTVIAGTALSLDATNSPFLNHENSESDREVVIGEKSLCLSDKVAFKRRVAQTLASSPFVPLPDGDYTFTARVKNSGGFTRLELYGASNGKVFTHRIKAENAQWQTVRLEHIKIRKGKAEIGFMAEGSANAFCYVDDVMLLKSK